jgi:hypothetical protein
MGSGPRKVSWNFDKRRTPAQAAGSNSFMPVKMSRPQTETQPIKKNRKIAPFFAPGSGAPLHQKLECGTFRKWFWKLS